MVLYLKSSTKGLAPILPVHRGQQTFNFDYLMSKKHVHFKSIKILGSLIRHVMQDTLVACKEKDLSIITYVISLLE